MSFLLNSNIGGNDYSYDDILNDRPIAADSISNSQEDEVSFMASRLLMSASIIDLSKSNPFDGETGTITLWFRINTQNLTNITYTASINNVVVASQIGNFSSEQVVGVELLKNLFTVGNNTVGVYFENSTHELLITLPNLIIKENRNTFTFVRNFNFEAEYDLHNARITNSQGISALPGEITGYVVSKHAIRLEGKANIRRIVLDAPASAQTVMTVTENMNKVNDFVDKVFLNYVIDFNRFSQINQLILV